MNRQHLMAFWHGELASLYRGCITASPAAEAEWLAMGVATLAVTPGAKVNGAGGTAHPARIARMVDAGAGLCAALALLGEEAGYMLSRGGSGRAIATVLLPGQAGEVTAEAATPALAVLAAYSAALQAAGNSHNEPVLGRRRQASFQAHHNR